MRFGSAHLFVGIPCPEPVYKKPARKAPEPALYPLNNDRRPEIHPHSNTALLAPFRRIPREDRLVVGWVLAVKLLLFTFGAKSYQVLENRRCPNLRAWLEIWNRWDSLHYLRLAQFGYSPKDILQSWFYPLYPWTVRLFAYLSGDYLVAGLIVSGLASIAAALLLRRLVAMDHSAAVARRAVFFFLIFPTAYFSHIAYTESLFLACALASLLAARSERWFLAGVLGALAWMTRGNGLILIPTLAVEAAHQYWITRRWNWRWLWILIILAGFGVYLLVNFKITGSAFAFLQLRPKLFATTFAWPWVSIQSALGNLRRGPADAEMVGAHELYFAALSFICAVISWIKLRPIYATWITGNWLLITSASFLTGMPRYVLPLFPIFILFAMAAANRFWNLVLTVGSLLYLALFTSIFVRGWWAF